MPTKSTTQKGGIEIFNLVVKFISGTEIKLNDVISHEKNPFERDRPQRIQSNHS